MKKLSKKQMYWGGSIILALALLWYFRNQAKSKAFQVSGKTDEWKNTVSAAPATLDGNKILKVGVSGPEVVALQMALKAAGADLGTYGPGKDGIDGVFGPKTETALFASRGVKQTTINQFNQSVSQAVAEAVKNTTTIYN